MKKYITPELKLSKLIAYEALLADASLGIDIGGMEDTEDSEDFEP